MLPSAPLRLRFRRGGITALVGLAVALRSGALQAQPAGPAPLEEGYSLLRAVDLPVSASFNRDGVPYDVDNAEALKGPFDRVAYRLVLRDVEGKESYVWVSMDAFTDDLGALGIPAVGSGAFFQRPAYSMTYISNVASVGVDPNLPFAIETGWIEFWPGDYGPANAAKVKGASDSTFDSGDSAYGGGDYGSFQVHFPTRGLTLLAYNHWGAAGGATSDIGIGNNPLAATGAGHPDWTFAANAGDWASRRLEIWIRSQAEPADHVLTSPVAHQIFQRDAANRAQVTVSGDFGRPTGPLEWTSGSLNNARGHDGSTPRDEGLWIALGRSSPTGRFSAIVSLPFGYDYVAVRARPAEGGDWLLGRVFPVGVGDIFLTAGQSNSANHGAPPQWPRFRQTAAGSLSLDPTAALSITWRAATDPQPIATGTGGSPWPALGDALAENMGVPTGFISVGWGGTTIGQWQPGGSLYPRIERALRALGPGGLRAVLWHQGESDAAGGTTREAYRAALTNIIQASRRDAGFEVPWLIAQAAFLPGVPQAQIDEVLAAQRALPGALPGVYSGPLTDDLTGEAWRYDGVHFNGDGLTLHGQRWAEALRASGIIPPRPEPTAIPSVTATDVPTVTALPTAPMPRLVLPVVGR